MLPFAFAAIVAILILRHADADITPIITDYAAATYAAAIDAIRRYIRR